MSEAFQVSNPTEKKENDPELRITCIPLKTGLLNLHETTFHVLTEFSTGAMPKEIAERKRTPTALSIVLDRSGSMNGRPLKEAIKCAKYIIDNAQDTDYISLVSYDSNAKILAPLLICNKENKQFLIQRLSQIRSGGSTNLEKGWRFGALTIEEAMQNNKLPSNTLKRIFLLSDGQLNSGITDHDIITESCSKYAALGISTSTYGLGHHFNEQIMVDILEDTNKKINPQIITGKMTTKKVNLNPSQNPRTNAALKSCQAAQISQ